MVIQVIIMKTLSDLKPGEYGFVSKILTKGSMRRRFMDIGLLENSRVECVGESPMGDPKAYLICGAVIAIRSEDGKEIIISENIESDTAGDT